MRWKAQARWVAPAVAFLAASQVERPISCSAIPAPHLPASISLPSDTHPSDFRSPLVTRYYMYHAPLQTSQTILAQTAFYNLITQAFIFCTFFLFSPFCTVMATMMSSTMIVAPQALSSGSAVAFNNGGLRTNLNMAPMRRRSLIVRAAGEPGTGKDERVCIAFPEPM